MTSSSPMLSAALPISWPEELRIQPVSRPVLCKSVRKTLPPEPPFFEDAVLGDPSPKQPRLFPALSLQDSYKNYLLHLSQAWIRMTENPHIYMVPQTPTY